MVARMLSKNQDLTLPLPSLCSCTFPLIRTSGLYLPAEGESPAPTKFLESSSSTTCHLTTTDSLATPVVIRAIVKARLQGTGRGLLSYP